MNKGKVKWYNRAKGFGFIQQEQGSDIFVHHSALSGLSIKENDLVKFEIGQGPKGNCAINIQVLNESPQN